MLDTHDIAPEISPNLDPAALYENWIHAEKQRSDLEAQKNDLEAEKSLWGEKEKSLQEELERLRALLIQMKQQAYGRKSDKLNLDPMTPLPGFENVFDEVHTEPAEEVPTAPQEETETKPQGQKKKGRRPLPFHLPRVQVIHDLEGDKVCSCGHPLHKIGEEISEQLDYIPAKVQVLQNVRYKYGCRGCEDTVQTADLKGQPLPKCNASPSLLAHILISKYQDHLPLYRQSQIWERLGIDLGRATMSRWVLEIGDRLSPLVELMRQEIVKSDYVRADETRVQVLQEPGRKATTDSYMWAYMTGASPNAIVVYEYTQTRHGENAKEFLKGFKGRLQSDGYSGYKALAKAEDITAVGCWAHARRKFADIVKSTGNTNSKSAEAVLIIKKLYKIEEEIRQAQYPPDRIRQIRQEKSKPILETFKVWLEDLHKVAVPKSPFGKAVTYVLKQWKPLTAFLDDGSLDIDNNACERAIRPFAIGRKNWLFMGNPRGAKASAAIYSLIETCKLNDICPYAYLTSVLTRINSTDQKNYFDLLPWNIKHSLVNSHQ